MTKDCPDGSKKDGGFVLPEIVSLYCQFGTSRREIQIFDIVLPLEASRGIRSKKLLNAVQSRIKFCIVWGQFYICPRPKHKFQIWRCQMEMAVFFDAVWASLALHINSVIDLPPHRITSCASPPSSRSPSAAWAGSPRSTRSTASFTSSIPTRDNVSIGSHNTLGNRTVPWLDYKIIFVLPSVAEINANTYFKTPFNSLTRSSKQMSEYTVMNIG